MTLEGGCTFELLLSDLQATKLKRRAQAMYTNVKRNAKENGTTWRSFENTLQVLVRVGALDPKTYKTSILGSVARELNADNELWFAMVLANKALEVPPF